jgi:hypothetical protein
VVRRASHTDLQVQRHRLSTAFHKFGDVFTSAGSPGLFTGRTGLRAGHFGDRILPPSDRQRRRSYQELPP